MTKFTPIYYKEECSCSVERIGSAFKCRIVSHRISPTKQHIYHTDFFEDVRYTVLEIFEKYRKERNSSKINCVLFATYIIPHKEVVDLKSFNTNNRVWLQTTDLTDLYNEFQKEIKSNAEKIQERNFGWALEQIMYLEVNVNRYNPLNASEYITKTNSNQHYKQW